MCAMTNPFFGTFSQIQVANYESIMVYKCCFTILNEDGSPMPGISVHELGTSNGTISDLDGKVCINVESQESILSISFIGYNSIQVKAGSINGVVYLIPDESDI